ncbi:MAG: MBL fold metallo-hydrolase [Bacteroidales bacterium]|nr:MBL fold metallo-hydrolase [Bacteroidales bacterium]
MQVRLLGTGTSQGIPIIGCHCPVCTSEDPRDHRFRTSALVTVDGLNILIDTGPDLRIQLLRAGVTRLDAVLYTHEHRDHTAGLDDVRPINFLMKQTLNLYGLPRVMRALRREFEYAFAEHKYPGVPTIALNPIQPEPFMIGNVEVQPIRVRHMTLPILGYRIRNFAYITDGSFISTTELKKLQGVDVLVINALRKEEHYSHFNLEQALAIIRTVAPRRAYLTHISHHLGLYKELTPTLPDNVSLGIDNEVIEVASL